MEMFGVELRLIWDLRTETHFPIFASAFIIRRHREWEDPVSCFLFVLFVGQKNVRSVIF